MTAQAKLKLRIMDKVQAYAEIYALVAARIDVAAYRARAEIHANSEFARRSLGQKVRFAMERIGR